MLALEHFAPLVGERFSVHGKADLSLGVSLVAAMKLGAADCDGRQPFALMFEGPGTPVLAQGTYRVEHRALGAPSIFLVPVQGGQSDVRYEAVFN